MGAPQNPLIYLVVVCLLFCIFDTVYSGHRAALLRTSDFSGSQLISVFAETEEQLKALTGLYEREDFDFWGTPALNESTNILVTSEQQRKFNKFLDKYELNSHVVIDDVYGLARNQQKQLVKVRDANEMSWDAYHYPETIFSWMNQLRSQYRHLVEILTIGESFEEQPINLVKISNGKLRRGSQKKYGVFIDGGIHAREWISPAVATYIMNDLVRNASLNSDLLDTYDFYILPLFNPDGYRHSCGWNRFWRKSRRSYGFLPDLVGCRGIDLNRNFGYHWRDGGWGSSGFNPCSLIYAGTAPFSEPETKAVKDFIEGNPDIEWQFYFSLHSFGQKWMTPWGFTKERPDDYLEMMRVANIGNRALYDVHGTTYKVGSIRETLYTASGTSSDWFKSIGVPYSYAIELRDYGLFGFLLPAYQIIPTSEEVWAGIQASLRAVRRDIKAGRKHSQMNLTRSY